MIKFSYFSKLAFVLVLVFALHIVIECADHEKVSEPEGLEQDSSETLKNLKKVSVDQDTESEILEQKIESTESTQGNEQVDPVVNEVDQNKVISPLDDNAVPSEKNNQDIDQGKEPQNLDPKQANNEQSNNNEHEDLNVMNVNIEATKEVGPAGVFDFFTDMLGGQENHKLKEKIHVERPTTPKKHNEEQKGSNQNSKIEKSSDTDNSRLIIFKKIDDEFIVQPELFESDIFKAPELNQVYIRDSRNPRGVELHVSGGDSVSRRVVGIASVIRRIAHWLKKLVITNRLAAKMYLLYHLAQDDGNNPYSVLAIGTSGEIVHDEIIRNGIISAPFEIYLGKELKKISDGFSTTISALKSDNIRFIRLTKVILSWPKQILIAEHSAGRIVISLSRNLAGLIYALNHYELVSVSVVGGPNYPGEVVWMTEKKQEEYLHQKIVDADNEIKG